MPVEREHLPVLGLRVEPKEAGLLAGFRHDRVAHSVQQHVGDRAVLVTIDHQLDPVDVLHPLARHSSGFIAVCVMRVGVSAQHALPRERQQVKRAGFRLDEQPVAAGFPDVDVKAPVCASASLARI